MKRVSVVFLLIALASYVVAYDFDVDGVYYKYVGEGKDSVAVARSWHYYKGDVVIPSSVVYEKKRLVVCEIGYNAFYNCDDLTSVTIPHSVTTIGSYAFEDCDGLTSVTIPNSVTTIGNHAFSGCDGLTSVTIPNSVTTIGSYSFYRCKNLESIVVDNNNKNYDSRDNCNAIIETNSNVLIYGCKNTKIPNSVTTIGYSAFENCDSLKSIIIPNSVTVIEKETFSGCKGLTSVTIPNSVTTIESFAFSGCKGLTSVTIPNSVTTIGSYAFSGCDGLTSVTIPYSVTTIESSAFSDCKGLTSVTIPNSVTAIGSYAFSGCKGLTSVTIPNSVTTIGSHAFSGCDGLTNIKIPSSVTTIGSNPFYGCKNLERIVVDSNNKNYDSRDNCNAIIKTDGNILISRCKATKIPSSVTAFGANIYSSSDSLTSITIPNNVTTIGASAFSGRSDLKSVSIPNSVTTIESSAFYDCDGLTSVTIPNSVTTIGYSAFENCDSLKSIIIPNSVTVIEKETFKGCKGLTSVTIPNSVTTIESSAFYDCDGLTSVTIPNSVTAIGSYAFSDCKGLTSVTIPNSVTTIGSYAFKNCDGLTSVILSNGSVDIDRDAFYGCKSLKHISVPKDFDLKKLDLPKGIKVTHTPIIFSEIAIDSIKYEGKTKDGKIRCNEKGNLYLLVRNSSYGKAKDAIAKITVNGATKGIEIPKEQELGDLPQKQSTWVKIPIETTNKTIDGKINVKVMVRDDYGMRTNEKEIEIKTHKLPVPNLRIVSHILLMDYDTVLSKAKTFELEVVLRNEGDAVARRHNVTATIPEGMILYSNGSIALPDIEPGEEDTLTFKLSSYDNIRDYVTLKFTILKSAKERVESYDVDLQFNKTKTTPKNIIQNSIPERVGIDSIAIVGSVVLQQYTSLELISNKWARYKSNHVVLKIKISGDKPETIRRAKELLNVNLGTQLGANGVHKGEPNEIWFLIPAEARRILLTCGDGCKEIEIWNGELKNNSVYQGEIRVY